MSRHHTCSRSTPPRPAATQSRRDAALEAASHGDLDQAILLIVNELTRVDGIRDRLSLYRLLVEWSSALSDSVSCKRFASEAVRVGREHLAPTDPDLLVARNSELYWMCMVGYDIIAAPRFAPLIADIRTGLGANSALEWAARINSALPAEHAADFEKAERIYRTLICDMSTVLPVDDLMMLTARDNLAEVLALDGRPEAAREIYDDLLLVLSERFGPDDPRTLRVRGEIAHCHYQDGDCDLARRQWEHLTLDCERVLGPHDSRSVHFRSLVIAAALDAEDDEGAAAWCAPLVENPPEDFTEVEREEAALLLDGCRRRLRDDDEAS